MYQNIANQNPLINQFNTYMTQNPSVIPFQGNQLINHNVHVRNNLNELMHLQRTFKPTPNVNMMQSEQINRRKSNVKNENIIEEMLKPQKMIKNNEDIDSNYKARCELQEKTKRGDVTVKMTNKPYKPIIRDRAITKKIEEIKESDLVVHKVDKMLMPIKIFLIKNWWLKM